MKPASTTKLVITPGNVTTIDEGGGGRLKRARDLMGRTSAVVGWNLRKRAFDKSTGPLFLVIDPMMQALLYFYIVYVVFGVRGDDVSYTAIFTLVTLWRGHALIVGGAPYYLSGQASILQQTRYSPLALVAESIATDAALFFFMVLIILTILLISGEGPHLTWLALPIILLINFLFSAACAVLVACAGIYVRETGIITNFIVSLWMYASPVVYGMERISEPIRTFYIWFNPFAHIMPAYRGALLQGEWPAFWPLFVITLISLGMLALGIAWVARLRGRIYRYL